MSDSSKRAKPASVAAFLFLPQFGHMFRSSSYLIPVFIRTVAGLFVQAKLLPPTHPAFNYGEPGVEKCGFARMMGDAWYTVRSTSSTPYQWSVFCSVLLLIFILISSVIMTALNFSVTFIGSAAAQVYTGPLGATDIASIPGLPGPCTAATPFCRIIPPLGTPHGDYAINILDGMLRRGTVAGMGGPLQNAMGGLMQVYNAGILVVAGLMLFWLVVAVVVDIAKTGQIGGGRHNLVWAPIRIVFALGMMIPLGTTGYSSGQFAVMKIAEWGSNFGTNGWLAYLNIISKSATIVPPLNLGKDLMPLIGAYERMWICRVAHNGYGYQAEGAAFITGAPLMQQPQEVSLRPDEALIDKGEASYAFTNNTANALCGRVTFPTGNAPALLTLTTPPPAGVTYDPVAVASAKFKVAMDVAWQKLFAPGYTQASQGDTDRDPPIPGTPGGLANAFACGFVHQHVWGTVGVGGPDVLQLDCTNYMGKQCGSGVGGSGIYPDMTCVDDPKNELSPATMTGYVADTIYVTATNERNTLAALPVSTLFGQRGWADMGSYYRAITTLTLTVQGGLEVPVHITGPAIQDSSDNQAAKVEEVLGKFNDWWNTVPNGKKGPVPPLACMANPPPPGAGCPNFSHMGGGFSLGGLFSIGKAAVGGIVGAVGTVVHVGEDIVNGAKKIIGMVGDFAKDPSGALLKELSHIVSEHEGTSFLGIPSATDPNHVNDYPLQILSSAGSVLMQIATDIYEVITGIEMIAAAIPTVALGATLTTSLLGHLMQIFGDTLMMCGAILVFYLPLLPFIRVAHAVLTWMVAVFEAVMLVPIACLSFLDTEKEGMYNKLPFINWLDILVRPILVVIGFVGAILVFDTFFAYFQDSFANATSAEVAGTSILHHFLAMFANAVLFCLIMYTAANTCFKLVTTIPNAFFRWIPGGQASAFSDDGGDHSGAIGKGGGMASQSMNKASGAENRTRKGIQGKNGAIDSQNQGQGGGSVTKT